MGTSVLSLRIDRDLLEHLRRHAAKRGMSVQDYVIQTLIRDDFDQRFQTAVEETERFYGAAGPTQGTSASSQAGQVSPSAGIR